MNPELDEKLSALLDGELPPAEAAALRAEIARSPALASRLAMLAAVDDGLRALPSRPAPRELRARVARALRRAPRSGAIPGRPRSGATPGRPRSGAIPGRRRWLGAAALAAVAAALALVLLSRPARDGVRVAETEPTSAAEVAAPTEDLPVIEVLDLLAELDELEEKGQG